MYLSTNYWTNTGPKPTAHITRGKNRLKGYNDTFYLKDGSNFEIELYNPTQGRVLAKISLNGVSVSAGGIVINPGQRVFLERFIDEDRKFEFSTYWVGKTDLDKKAIEHNGLVEVAFFQEAGSPSWAPYWGGLTSTGSPLFFTTGANASYPINDGMTHTNYLNNLLTPIGSSDVKSSLVFDGSASSTYTSNASPKRTQTGRVEKGERSDQVLETAHGTFSQLILAACSFKLMPENQKTVEAGEIRNYCSGCGTRIKKSSWKFCPSCGTQIDD